MSEKSTFKTETKSAWKVGGDGHSTVKPVLFACTTLATLQK